MDFKKLEKAARIYKEIQSLDKEIIEIDRMAHLVANGKVESVFELKVKDLQKIEDEKAKVSFDEDGSLFSEDRNDDMRYFFISPIKSAYGISKPKINTNEIVLKETISENTTLNLLAVILSEKQSKRDSLIKQIQKTGVLI